MREETEYRPKPMVEIGGRPVLWHIMKTYAEHGVTEFIICAGYKGEMIKEYFLNYEARNNDFTIKLGARHEIEFHNAHLESDWKVTVADTGATTLTGGRIKAIEKYLGDDQEFMVTYGDGVSDVDITSELAYHRANNKIATLMTVQPPSRFGLLDVNAEGVVENFAEKIVEEDGGWINAGYMIFNREVFKYLDSDMLEKYSLPKLAKDKQLNAWHHKGFWQPMDTVRESMMLNEMWDSGDAPWKVWEQ